RIQAHPEQCTLPCCEEETTEDVTWGMLFDCRCRSPYRCGRYVELFGKVNQEGARHLLSFWVVLNFAFATRGDGHLTRKIIVCQNIWWGNLIRCPSPYQT